MKDLMEILTYVVLVALMMGGWRTLKRGSQNRDKRDIVLGILLYVAMAVFYFFSMKLLGKA